MHVRKGNAADVYTFLMMLKDYIDNHNMHWFLVFFLFVLIRWVVIFAAASGYRRYEQETDGDSGAYFSSVIIPVMDEPVELFERVLSEILKQNPSELIVVANGAYPKKLMRLCHEYEEKCGDEGHPTRMLTLHTSVPGKRNAIRLGMEHIDPQSEICILVDSDTIWTENTLLELMKPFAADERIGGVTTRQKIFHENRSLVTMTASLLEEIRAEGTMKAMSAAGKVGCLPGRTIAFRTSILKQVMDEFMTEVFMGIHNEVSDDRSLTNLTLKLGYKTVLQDSALVYTDAPADWRTFTRQQLRWSAGSQYNNLKMTPWMLRHAPLMAFIYWSDMLMPILLISLYLNFLSCMILKSFGVAVLGVIYTGPVWLLPVLIIVSCILGFGVRHIRVFLNLPWYYILFIPVLILVLSFLMVYIRIAGLMRCADGTRWGTRFVSDEVSQDETIS